MKFKHGKEDQVKKKVKRSIRREWMRSGTLSFNFEVSVNARSQKDAERVAYDALDGLRFPKVLRVKVGKRRTLLKEYKDYWLDYTDLNVQYEGPAEPND